MQGKQAIPKDQSVSINLESFVPVEHELRRLDRVLNLSFIRKLTRHLYCSNNGRPSIDPETYFRMQIIAYLYGIESDRRLCQEVHLNLAYRWFVRIALSERVPEHSSMTRIRDRLGEDIFRQIFETIVRQCRKAGLVVGKRLIVDATVIRANASMSSLEPCTNSMSNEIKPHQERYHDYKLGKRRRKYSNKTHRSSSDPDASLVTQQNSHHRLCYKVHYTIDAKRRVIVDCYVTTGAQHEGPVLPDRIKYVLRRFRFPLREVLADKGYGRGPTYAYFMSNRIRTYIPLHDDRIGQGTISKGEFTYDGRNDRYKCPTGHYLYPYEKADRGIKRYRIIGGSCRGCPLRTACIPAKQKHRARFIYRHPQQAEIDRVRQRQQTKKFKDRMQERGWKIEGIFGEAKALHCLRQARYRRRSKVQIQAYLTAIVQNLKRAARATSPTATRRMSPSFTAVNIASTNKNLIHVSSA